MKLPLTKKWFLVLETTYLIVIPTILSVFWPRLLILRTWIMLGSLVYLAWIIYSWKINLADTGLTKKNFISASRAIMWPTILSTIILIALGLAGIRIGMFPQIIDDVVGYGPIIIALFLYMFISVPLQEYIFKGFYITRLEFVSKKKWFLILYSAAIFTSIHLLFGNLYLLVATFIFGIWSANIFLKYRNLYPIIISHAIIGGAEILRQILILKQE